MTEEKQYSEHDAALIERTKDTRFGAERANKRYSELPGSNAPWSLRNEMRKLSVMEVDPEDKNALKNLLTEDGKRKPTIAQMTAMAMVKQALNGNVRAINSMADNIEGKLTQSYTNDDPMPMSPPVINVIMRGKDEPK